MRAAALESFATVHAPLRHARKGKAVGRNRTGLMLVNRQYAKLSGNVERARKAVTLIPATGKLQELVHAAEANELLAALSPSDRCPALREAAKAWEKAALQPFGTAIAKPRLRALNRGDCGKP
jgi:hypothetical protein